MGGKHGFEIYLCILLQNHRGVRPGWKEIMKDVTEARNFAQEEAGGDIQADKGAYTLNAV